MSRKADMIKTYLVIHVFDNQANFGIRLLPVLEMEEKGWSFNI